MAHSIGTLGSLQFPATAPIGNTSRQSPLGFSDHITSCFIVPERHQPGMTQVVVWSPHALPEWVTGFVGGWLLNYG